MAIRKDGPSSRQFKPVTLRGNVALSGLRRAGVSKEMASAVEHAPAGAVVAWGVPFRVGKVVAVTNKPVTVKVAPLKAPWVVFLHTSDVRPRTTDAKGFLISKRGGGELGEPAAEYVVVYADGSEQRLPIRRRREIGMFQRRWSENCFDAVVDSKPRPTGMGGQDILRMGEWGARQTRVDTGEGRPWLNWLWAWANPHPRKAITAIRFEPRVGSVVVLGLAAGRASDMPFRWQRRRKAILTLPKGVKFNPALDGEGMLKQIRLDMGQVISAIRRPIYPDRTWSRTPNNALPDISDREILVEYTAHPDARFHLPGGKTVPAARVASAGRSGPIRAVAPSEQRVTIRVVDKKTRRPVPVKLHLHGEAGEYLAPVDRHRIPNPFHFQDYSVDFLHQGMHWCTYIDGETDVFLPPGRVYLEVSKGFEIRPVRRVLRVTGRTRRITIEVAKVLPWRQAGWVSADTHVHFLSPLSALLEGAGEGVNIVNLLATQWGELVTNAGDFDGKTTFGSREAGGDGEHMVRVGTENRQHILGHISLLGYGGRMIAPTTTGGPDESAIGDPVGVLMTDWARQCRAQGGLVVMPHFPSPRAESAAILVNEDADAVEMTSWGDLYGGIDPYSLGDWYRYLNCGYLVPAVGGTDKMSAGTAVGTVRTYARINRNRAFTYAAWQDAVRRGQTFVTYGPLMEFAVEGKPAGTRMKMKSTGGTVDVTWEAATVTMPMTRVEVMVNGEVRASRRIRPDADRGHFSLKVDRSCWIALLIRGRYRGKPEVIAAHSSPVMIDVKNSPLLAAADAVTILEQIEGTLAFLDTVGTRAETAAYKRMRLILTGAHRRLHNRMHRLGRYHDHNPATDHAEHH